MLENYLPILIFLSVALALGLLMLSIGFLFGKGTKAKQNSHRMNVVLIHLKMPEYPLMFVITWLQYFSSFLI